MMMLLPLPLKSVTTVTTQLRLTLIPKMIFYAILEHGSVLIRNIKNKKLIKRVVAAVTVSTLVFLNESSIMMRRPKE